MKNHAFRKTISLLTALILLCGLVTSASATTVPEAAGIEMMTATNPEGARSKATSNEATLTGLEVQPIYNPYLSDVAAILDGNPTIVTDEASSVNYLSFGLATASKLDYLLQQKLRAFQLETFLARLEGLNSFEKALHETPSWRSDGVTIGSMLSKETVERLNEMPGIGGYLAIKFVKTRPEYQTNERLRQDVDYYLFSTESLSRDVFEGVELLLTNEEKMEKLTRDILDKTLLLVDGQKVLHIDLTDEADNFDADETTCFDAEMAIAAAHELLDAHPEFACLDEVYQVYIHGETSKFLATLWALDEAQVTDLYAKVRSATENVWPECQHVENYRFIVPFPMGTTYAWPTSK